MLRRAALTALLLLLVVATVQAAGPRFWRLEGTAAFLEGEIENLSLDAEARLRLGPTVRTLFDPAAPNAWCVASDDAGVLYVGTGNEGRVYRIDGDEGRVVFDADELEVYAVAVGPDGQVYAATSPDGAVYVLEADGPARSFFDPPEPYVWALAFDTAGDLLVGAGGDEGRVYRVHPDGSSDTLLSSAETHVLSLAVDEDGRVFAGSSPEGLVYRIDAAGKVFVLLDSPFQEIKALAVGGDGAVYAAAVNGGAPSAPPPSAGPSGAADAPAAAPVAQVTVTETFAVVSPAGGAPGATTAPSPSASATPRGALLRIDPAGTVERLWSSTDDVPHSLVRADEGVLLGTGDKGKLYRVTGQGAWALLASLRAQQVTGLVSRPGRPVALVTSNPARVVALSEDTAAEGTFVSEVKDAEAVAAWGRLRWEGSAPPGAEVRLETRSGNTATPDTTWASWTAVAGGSPVAGIRSESARFLQVRVTLAGRDGASPEIEALSLAYLQRNLRPRVTSITVHPPGQVFQKPISVSGEPEVLGLETDPLEEGRADRRAPSAAPVTAFSRTFQQKGLRTFTWNAEDPNSDALVYDVQYRAQGDTRWRTLHKGLTEAVLAWDTTAVPDGRYLVRVTASDGPDNPPSLALTSHDDSKSFQVDNAPPSLAASLVEGGGPGTIRATARDAGSPIRRLEVSVDAGRWQEVYPTDGINDSMEEVYEFPLPAGTGPGPHVVVLRVSDRLGNVATGRVDVP
jgi:sugar lactone lactonase YvrE